MTQEDKMLLIKDLSSRLPYAVHVQHTSGFSGTLHDITIYHKYDEHDNIYDAICYTDFFGEDDSITIEHFKPYLFPLPSMTEEQKKEFDQLLELELKAINDEINHTQATAFEVDFYHKHHLDWRGLIPKGLANDATGLNIY